MAVTKYQLLSAATATNSAPSGNRAGIALNGSFDRGTIALKSTAGSGTMDVTLKLWGYVDALAAWVPLGTHATDANRGRLNGAVAIGEVVANSLEFAELVDGLSTFSRLYLEIVAINGTSTAVSAWLIPRRPGK